MAGYAGRLARWVMAGVGVALLASCTSVEPPDFVRAEGEMAYTRVNMWYPANRKILSMNCHQGTRLPAGSKVKITQRLANGLTFMTRDSLEFSVVLMPKFTPISTEELASRLFSKIDVFGPDQPAELFTSEELENIERGTVAAGMSKEAVLMAYGYPPGHRTPDLKEDVWLYWLAPRTRQATELKFRNNRLQAIDGVAGRQTVRIYAVSDPAGALIEVEGAFAGKAPCILTLSVEPELMGKQRTIRATPGKAESPRLGVSCGMPVGGAVVGEYIAVTDVLPLSTAHRMGIRRGDRIVSIAGAAVRSDRECFEVVKNLGFNREFTLVVRRGPGEVALKGRTEEIASGRLEPRERVLMGGQLLELDGQALVFDLREKAGGAAAAVPAVSHEAAGGEPARPVSGPESSSEPIPAVGSGLVVARGGYVLTCAHLVSGARTIKVRTAAGVEFPAEVMKTDAGNGWCLLRAKGLEAAPVPWGEPGALSRGGRLFCVGYPLDPATGKAAPTPDVRSGSILETVGLDGDARHIQAAMALTEGYSGSGLLDGRGRLAGMVSDRLNGLIQAMAPRGAVTPGTVFAARVEGVEHWLPAEVRVERPAVGSAGGRDLTVDEIGKASAQWAVMIRAWR